MKNHPGLQLRYKLIAGKKGYEAVFTASQMGRGTVTFQHPDITIHGSKAFKPLLEAIVEDFEKVSTSFQREAFVAGLTKRSVFVTKASEINRSILFIGRNTSITVNNTILASDGWINILLPSLLTAEVAEKYTETLLRTVQALLTDI